MPYDDNAVPPANPWFQNIQNATFLLLVLGTSALFIWTIHGFLQPVFWALLLAVLFHAVYAFLGRLTRGRKRVASLLTLLVIGLGVVIPLILLGISVMQESMQLYQRIGSGEIKVQKGLAYLEDTLPFITELLDKVGLDWAKLKQQISQTAVEASRLIATNLFSIGQNAVRLVIMVAMTFYLLYFFLKDGQGLVNVAMRVLPLDQTRQKKLVSRFVEVSRATIKGTFVVAVVQGGLGGILFALLGIDAATFWGVIMTILSLLPVVGSALIWGPAAVILMATGSLVKGIVLLAVGMVLIGLADNVLRPVLVGRETRLPDYLVLIATLGGISVFGISGFVIGPVLAALFLTVWDMFGQEFVAPADTDTAG